MILRFSWWLWASTDDRLNLADDSELRLMIPLTWRFWALTDESFNLADGIELVGGGSKPEENSQHGSWIMDLGSLRSQKFHNHLHCHNAIFVTQLASRLLDCAKFRFCIFSTRSMTGSRVLPSCSRLLPFTVPHSTIHQISVVLRKEVLVDDRERAFNPLTKFTEFSLKTTSLACGYCYLQPLARNLLLWILFQPQKTTELILFILQEPQYCPVRSIFLIWSHHGPLHVKTLPRSGCWGGNRQ